MKYFRLKSEKLIENADYPFILLSFSNKWHIGFLYPVPWHVSSLTCLHQ